MAQNVIDILLRLHAKLDEVTSAQRAVANLSRSFGSLARVAGVISGVHLSFQTLLAGIRSSISGTIELAQKFDELAKRFDTTEEAIQVVDYAARRNGQSVDQLASFADKLQDKLTEAAAGGVSAAEDFGALGLSIGELLKLPFERRMQTFGRALLNTEGDAKAYAAAVDIAGSDSQKFFDTLRDLALFDRVAAGAHKAGQVMKTEFVAQLTEARQQLEDAERRWQVFMARIIPPAVDALDGASKTSRLRAWVEDQRNATLLNAPMQSLQSSGIEGRVPDATGLREEQAQIWLGSEEAKRMRERVQAGEEAFATDRQRLEILQIRLRVLDDERVIALQAAGSQAEREATSLQYSESMLAVMKDIESVQKSIEASEKQAQGERERALAVEIQRRQLVLDRLQFEREQIADRQDISELEKQRQIKALVEAQRAIVADMLRLKRETLATATEAERVQLEADIQSLEQQMQTIGKGIEPGVVSWERQIGLAEQLSSGIDGVSRALADAAVRGTDLRSSLANVFQSIAADIAAATIKALIFQSIMGAAPEFGQFLGLQGMGYGTGMGAGGNPFGGLASIMGGGSTLTGASGGWPGIHGLLLQGLLGGFADGGYGRSRYTGPGPRMRVAGVVHAGEGVIDKPTLDRHGGAPFFSGLLSSLRLAPGYAAGGYVGQIVRGGGRDATQTGDVIQITNHFSSGFQASQLAAQMADMERRQRRGIADAVRRRKDGFGAGGGLTRGRQF